MVERDGAGDRGSMLSPRFRRAMALAASAFKKLLELVGALAALIAILQALRLWP